MIVVTTIDADNVIESRPIHIGGLGKFMSEVGDRKMWVDVSNPNELEIDEVAGEFGIDVALMLCEDIGASVEPCGGYTFFTLNTCLLEDADDKVTGNPIIYSDQIRFFVSETFIVTFSYHGQPCFDLMAPVTHGRKVVSHDNFINRYLFFLVEDILRKYGEVIEAMKTTLEKLEDRVDDNYIQGVRPIIKYVKRKWSFMDGLIDKQKAAYRPTRLVAMGYLSDNIGKVLNQIYDNMESYAKQLENIKDVMKDISDIYSYINQSDINKNIYILTIITAVFSFLAFASGYYGMNVVGLPIANRPWGIFVITGFMLTVLFSGLFVGIRKHRSLKVEDDV